MERVLKHLFPILRQRPIWTPVNTSTNNQSIVYGHAAMFIALSNGDYVAPCLTFDAPAVSEVSSTNSVFLYDSHENSFAS